MRTRVYTFDYHKKLLKKLNGGTIMKKLILIPALFLLSMALIVPTTYAKKGKCDGQHGQKGKQEMKLSEKLFHKAHMIIMNQEALGLTDQVVKEIKDLKIATKKSLIKQKAEIDLIAIDIKANLHQPKIDVKATNALVNKKYDLKKAKTKSIVKAFAKLKGKLTEEQMKKLKGLYAKKGLCAKCKKK